MEKIKRIRLQQFPTIHAKEKEIIFADQNSYFKLIRWFTGKNELDKELQIIQNRESRRNPIFRTALVM